MVGALIIKKKCFFELGCFLRLKYKFKSVLGHLLLIPENSMLDDVL